MASCVHLFPFFPLSSPSQHHEGENGIAGAGHNILAAVQNVCDRRVRDARTQDGVPQGLAGCRVQSNDILARPSAKNQVSRSSQQRGSRATLPLMSPFRLTGLIVNGVEKRFGVTAAVAAAPSL